MPRKDLGLGGKTETQETTGRDVDTKINDAADTALISAALDYAVKGWKVFPCRWEGEHAKAPLTRNGHLEATWDTETITRWWSRWPHAMIGAPVPDRLLVLDIDPRNGGDITDLGDIPQTLTCWSGREDGGRHLFFVRPAGSFTSTRLPSGIDLKVLGYTIVPPSIHPATGRPYRWEHHRVARLPLDLRELLRPVAPPVIRVVRRGDGKGLVAFVERQATNVNDALFWAANRAAEDGVLDQLAADLVAAAGAAARTAGTWTAAGERASWRTVESARKKASVA